MSDGILERIESKLDQLLEATKGAPIAAVVTEAPLPHLTDDAPIPAATATADPGAALRPELDSDGVPWDERIHSSNKKRSKDGAGPWVKRRGVDADLYAQVTAELKKSASAGTTERVVSDTAPATPPAPSSATPTPPAPAPAADNNTAPPPPAATPAPTENPTRKVAIEGIKALLNRHGVNADAVTQYYIDNYNCTLFEQIEADKFAGIVEDMDDWSARLDIVKENVTELKTIYAADVAVIEPFIAQECAKATLVDEPCKHYTDVAYDRLEPVEKGIADLLARCQTAAGN